MTLDYIQTTWNAVTEILKISSDWIFEASYDLLPLTALEVTF